MYPKLSFMTLKAYLQSMPRGGSAKFAAAMGVSPSYLSQMAAGTVPISPARCVEIEQKSYGSVRRQDMRDDWAEIWPELLGGRAA